jgi:hypothetical protein
MKTPIELPSGQILDLSRCITLKALNDSSYELIMEGYHQSLPISTIDALRLKQIFLARKEIPVWTAEEQQERNKIAMAKLQAMIDRDATKTFSPEAEQIFAEFQKIVDEQRSDGQNCFPHDSTTRFQHTQQGMQSKQCAREIHQIVWG